MSSFPEADDIISIWKDQLEALERLWRTRRTVLADPKSRFHGRSEQELDKRLEHVRSELDRATMMMVLASFEATIRSDSRDRIRSRTKDKVRRALSRLYKEANDRVRFDDILQAWESHVTISASTCGTVRQLLKHRHWLAHGRYWTDKSAIKLTPNDAKAYLDDYMSALQTLCPDFPR